MTSVNKQSSDELNLFSIANVLRQGANDFLKTVSVSSNEENNSSNNSNQLVNFKTHASPEVNAKKVESNKKKSEKLGALGNKKASNGEYQEAIEHYTEAITFCDQDYRLFCNRSYCNERQMNYFDAFKDARRAVILMPTRTKPFFRQGKALMGLKKYEEAECSFKKVLQLDSQCEDANNELMKVRYLALRDFGLDIDKASTAAIRYDCIGEAITKTIAMISNETQQNTPLMMTADNNIINSFKEPAKEAYHYSKTSQMQCERKLGQHLNFNSSKYTNLNCNLFAKENTQMRSARSGSRLRVNVTRNYERNSSIYSSSSLHKSLQYKRSKSVEYRVRYDNDSDRNEHNMSRHNTNVTHDQEQRPNFIPKNLFGYKGLWVGNVSPKCKVQTLRHVFSKFGRIDYINIIGNSFCAFVNYENANSGRYAIAHLQAQHVPGISNGHRPLIFRFIPSNDQRELHYQRPYQSKDIAECYFWRTTGCHDRKCKLIHYPICKGIDFQPWMNKKVDK